MRGVSVMAEKSNPTPNIDTAIKPEEINREEAEKQITSGVAAWILRKSSASEDSNVAALSYIGKVSGKLNHALFIKNPEGDWVTKNEKEIPLKDYLQTMAKLAKNPFSEEEKVKEKEITAADFRAALQPHNKNDMNVYPLGEKMMKLYESTYSDPFHKLYFEKNELELAKKAINTEIKFHDKDSSVKKNLTQMLSRIDRQIEKSAHQSVETKAGHAPAKENSHQPNQHSNEKKSSFAVKNPFKKTPSPGHR